MDLTVELEKGLKQLNLEVTEQQKTLFLDFLALLEKWNKAYNLTAIREIEKMLVLHLFDALSISPYINKENYIDVGTGAGIPGIPLAILFPEKYFTLLDSNGKKSRFQQQVKIELGLENIFPQQARVEDYNEQGVYDGVISRAFASLQDMLEGCAHLVKADGEFLAMKGEFPEEEIKNIGNIGAGFKVIQTYELKVPNLDAQRHLLCIKKL